MKRNICLSLLLIIILIVMVSCGCNDKVIGRWTANRLIIDGDCYTRKDIESIDYANTYISLWDLAWIDSYIWFYEDGSVILIRPSDSDSFDEQTSIAGKYTFDGSEITLISEDDFTDKKNIDINKGEIYWELDANTIVVFKK